MVHFRFCLLILNTNDVNTGAGEIDDLLENPGDGLAYGDGCNFEVIHRFVLKSKMYSLLGARALYMVAMRLDFS